MRAPTEPAFTRGELLLCVFLLWLAGIGSRITILAVPPVIPLIRTDFGMSETQVGILTGLPPVLFACAAVLGSLLIARFGALATLVAGLLVTAAGSALRGGAPEIFSLYAATIVTGFGVAIMHPSMPPLVRTWLPHRIGFGAAVFTNGLLVGEILPVALTIPMLLPLLHDGWRASFVVWAVPVALIAFVIMALAPRSSAPAQSTPAAQRWWPDWRDPLIWRLGIALGSVNAMYFSANAFLPDYLHHIGRADLVSAALTALNVGQIPASLLLLAVAGRLEREDLAACRVRRGFACRDHRHRDVAGSRHRDLCRRPRLLRRRGADPDAGAAAAAGAARGCASRIGGDVYHQLFMRGDHAGAERARLGPDRHRAVGVRAARPVRGAPDYHRADHPAAPRLSCAGAFGTIAGRSRFPHRRGLGAA